MASANFVLLLVTACVAYVSAQILGPQLGFPGSSFAPNPLLQPGAGGSPFGQSIGSNPFSQQGAGGFFQEPQILTCIGRNEALDQLKVTLRPEPGHNDFFPGNQGPMQLRRKTWRISAVYIPAASIGAISPPGTTSLVGQFFVAITRYGRTDGSCAGQGGVLQQADLIPAPGNSPYGGAPFNSPFRNPFLGGGRYGQFPGSFGRFPGLGGGLGGGIGGSRYGSFFGQGSGAPPGYIEDTIVISQGGNVFSGVVRGVSEADLTGKGFAICLDYLCTRPTTTCCSVAKDSAPATESIGVPNTGPYTGNALLSGAQIGNNGIIAGGVAGAGGIAGINTGVAAVASDNVGGLF